MPTPNQTLRRKINLFLARTSELPDRSWFEVSELSVYLRSVRSAGRIDCANITVHGDFQGKGLYRDFVAWLYKAAKRHGFDTVRHECVLNEILVARHRRHGLEENKAWPPSFLKKL